MPPAPPPVLREVLHRWLLALGLLALLLFFFSPSWAAFRLWQRVPEMGAMLEVRRGASVLQQIAHPGAPIPDTLHAAIQWRLLFPLVGRVLHLPPFAFFALAPLGCLLVLGFVVTVLRRRGAAWSDSALATVILGAASWFFTSTGWLGYFDSWLALALLIVAFADSRWVLWAACAWAPWVDERFLPAVVLAFLIRHLDRNRSGVPGPAFHWRRDLTVPAALLAAFVAVRFGLLAGQSASGATAAGYFGGRDYLDAPVSRIALGIWEGLRAGWLFVAAAVALSWRRGAPALVLAATVLVAVAGGLATAQDYSRSMTMIFPVGVYGAVLALPTVATWRPFALRLAAGAALLLPAHHVMNDLTNPIYYFYHELAAFDSPPPTAMSEVYELRAIHKMERGEFPAAEADLTLALKLAADPTSPAKQRGILYASQGRWRDALGDFSTMVDHAPENPDSWFMRAQAQLALSQPTAARADFDRALTLAPDGWARRPDVARFLAKLNQAR